MIRLELDTDMPQGCDYCPLMDEEFHYCHGKLCNLAWECDDYKEVRPEWCPLLEVRKSCTECMLGAPHENCWRTQCINYPFKKHKEEQWRNHVTEVVKQMEKKYET